MRPAQPVFLAARTKANRGSINRQEQARLAASIADPGRATLLVFYSEACSLCQAIVPTVDKMGSAEASWLDVVYACADHDHEWAPEMICYGIHGVPTAVLLNYEGACHCCFCFCTEGSCCCVLLLFPCAGANVQEHSTLELLCAHAHTCLESTMLRRASLSCSPSPCDAGYALARTQLPENRDRVESGLHSLVDFRAEAFTAAS